jgi:hypothetical protein
MYDALVHYAESFCTNLARVLNEEIPAPRDLEDGHVAATR